MKRRENGSVLIEAMVAAAVVALMLGAMYRSISNGAMSDRAVTEKRMALLVAQSEMDAVGTALPISPGSTGGAEGPFVWRVDIQPYVASQGASNAGPLYEVAISVREKAGGTALVTLRSLALGPVS